MKFSEWGILRTSLISLSTALPQQFLATRISSEPFFLCFWVVYTRLLMKASIWEETLMSALLEIPAVQNRSSSSKKIAFHLLIHSSHSHWAAFQLLNPLLSHTFQVHYRSSFKICLYIWKVIISSWTHCNCCQRTRDWWILYWGSICNTFFICIRIISCNS